MELNNVLAWINLGLLVAGFITLWISFGRKIGLLQSDLANGLKSISALMNSYGLFLGVLSTKKVFTAAEIQEIQKPYLEYAQGAIQQLLGRIGGGNPITASELEKIKTYVARAQRGELLTREEAQEFYNLSKKLGSEEPYKTDIGAIILVGLAAFILGFVVGSSNEAASK
ncbi:MAG: hypothetical protein N3E42_04375 [Candidatus Bipolaricaulota bacterium]|nr:hypothetical protein [Candidatus Bipolaricaulota bacterium]